MFRVLVIAAVFALGIAVGCSQKGGATATTVPESLAPTVLNTKATNGPILPTPTSATTAAANVPEQPVAPARAQQTSPFGRGFVPLDNPSFLAANDGGFFDDDELILGVEWGGEVRAYPVRMLRYHHVVNDTVGGEPLLVTY